MKGIGRIPVNLRQVRLLFRRNNRPRRNSGLRSRRRFILRARRNRGRKAALIEIT